MATPDQHEVAFLARAAELGHVLEMRDEDDGGGVNTFAMSTDEGFHNGPACVLCHDCWCIWCTPVDAIRPCSHTQKEK